MPVSTLSNARRIAHNTFNGPWLPALFPTLAIAGYLIGGEILLAFCALGLPGLWLTFRLMARSSQVSSSGDIVTGMLLKDQFRTMGDSVLEKCETSGLYTVCFLIEVENGPNLAERFGTGACDRLIDTLASRLRSTVREHDHLARMGDWEIGIFLAPVRHCDLEVAVQLATRLQDTIEDPVKLEAAPVYLTASIGFCISQEHRIRNAKDFIEATHLALDQARRNGPSAIRAYSSELKKQNVRQKTLTADAAKAIEHGDICPWFQPQISTETGALTGIEALARWQHAERGAISPEVFLPALEQQGLLERLGELMLFGALSTLRNFDKKGIVIPSIGVNFAQSDLSNPKLVERVEWELDRFGIGPQRLSIEILETVVAGAPDDMIVRNIAALSNLGCTIDLDDFGTGHASITSLRRFDVNRIKIDRSFVAHCDQDLDQQKMVATIISMAERLGLNTLAEGVETVGEHAMLAQLGCQHVQGFGIARPMPEEALMDWVQDHQSRIAPAPVIPLTLNTAKRRRE